MPTLYLRVPEERLGVLIGSRGVTRSEIERRTSARVTVDNDTGEVTVQSDDGQPMAALKARDVVWAIGRGFSPTRAYRLLEDDTYLGVIDIKAATGRREKAALWRIRSRLIGTDGKARARVEELSGCSMSVFGNTVALIGKEEQLTRATRAVGLLLRGSEHSVVFRLLARLRREDALTEALQPDPIADEE
ncbi:MAG: KH domain-containing protein [Thermoplasmata archaeon]